jgi:hypothetical protein
MMKWGKTMVNDVEKLEKARNVLLKIAKGIDPLTGEVIAADSFLNDPRIIRCFYYVAEVLEGVRNGAYAKPAGRAAEFVITPEQKSQIVLPEGKIGVNEFSKRVNACIDPSLSKNLSGVELNKRLKAMGILGEQPAGTGKTRTVTNETSAQYGFELEKRSYNGVEYEMVVINDRGKQFLLDNLETIMKAGE